MLAATQIEVGQLRVNKGCAFVFHIRHTVGFVLTFIDLQFFKCVLSFGLCVLLLTSQQMNTTHVFCWQCYVGRPHQKKLATLEELQVLHM
jgi:hypothetical protein